MKLFSCLFFSLLMIAPRGHLWAQEGGVDPKTKAFLVISGYGATGGALLGLASMAFGAKPRAIAQGASLGLYAGLLFAGYVLYTHGQQQAGESPGGGLEFAPPSSGQEETPGEIMNSPDQYYLPGDRSNSFFREQQQTQVPITLAYTWTF